MDPLLKGPALDLSGRINELDIIRGFALLGILVVNMPLFQSPQLIADLYMLPQPLSATDTWIRIILDVFVETKFFSIFSFLFGLGFFIFMERAAEKGRNVYTLYVRRLTMLAVFGALHLLFLWYGDILLTYAFAGFLLLLFYKLKPKTLLMIITIFTVALILLLSANFLLSPEELQKEIQVLQADGAGKMEEAILIYNTSSYLDWLSYRFSNEVIPLIKHLPFSMLTALYMFLLGLYVGKLNIISEFPKHKRLARNVWWISLIISIPLSFLIVALHLDMLTLRIPNSLSVQVIVTLSGLSLSIFYISTVLFLLQKEKWKKLFYPLSYLGRMALTNYIAQTVICVGIFTGFGLFGEINLALGLIMSFIILPLQILFSYFWLKYYLYGPLEWVWRSVTYGRVQPFRR
ncbi:DUF418 domain-containing protein [Anaerobacillus alkaliphilus]|uniref:DUF418 domain-containing protein n=1 Tax=Anaerobacillus alkaliphilus TaxID=1548597 RepID=UPI0013754B87|nr:DUF418 domain-containing protein [Anaerobacillus alkaliphilus]